MVVAAETYFLDGPPIKIYKVKVYIYQQNYLKSQLRCDTSWVSIGLLECILSQTIICKIKGPANERLGFSKFVVILLKRP